MTAETFGSETCCLRNVDVGGVPAVLLHSQRRVGVLGDGFDSDAADLIEGATTEDGAGAAEEGGVPEVVAVLNDSVEELAFVGDGSELVEIALEGIGRIEVMRGLQHPQLFVAQKPAHGDLQKAPGGDVIAVEDDDVGRVEFGEGVVDIAGLRVLVVVARHVADAGFFGKETELFAVSVVKEVDVEPVGGPVDVHGGEGCVLYEAERLVVGGDEEIDSGPLIDIVRQRDRSTTQRPECLEEAEKEYGEGVEFGEEEEADEEAVEKTPGRAGVEEEFEGSSQSPIAVAKGGEHRGQHQGQRDQVRAGAAVCPYD